jgi:hypothetical protein
METQEIKERINEAIEQLLACDMYLLVHNVHEQCISTALSYYLIPLFKK